MIYNLKTAFKALVNEATWMDSSTKAIAREKVDLMIENIGYPDWIKNKKKLENYYKEVKKIRKKLFYKCNVCLIL